jgi:hypothetical protein
MQGFLNKIKKVVIGSLDKLTSSAHSNTQGERCRARELRTQSFCAFQAASIFQEYVEQAMMASL